MLGFESVARGSEEADAHYKIGRIRRPILASLGIAVLLYIAVVLAFSSLLSKSAHTAKLSDFRFETVFGSGAIAGTILVVALFSLVKVYNGCLVAASRMLYGLANTGFVPSILGTVGRQGRVPLAAVTICSSAALIGPFCGKSVLVPISDVGSFTVTIGWLGSCLALVGLAIRSSSGRVRAWEVASAVTGILVCCVLVGLMLHPEAPAPLKSGQLLVIFLWALSGALVAVLTILRETGSAITT